MTGDLIRELECQSCHKEFQFPSRNKRDFSVDVYLLRNGARLPLHKQYGFCHSCDEFVWMERFPRRAEVLEQIAEYEKEISNFENGEHGLGLPTFEFYKSVVSHKADWLNLLASRPQATCLACGMYDVLPVTEDQIWKVEGDIGVLHGSCDGAIWGRFYDSRNPSIRVNPDRYNRNTPIWFIEYSARGHKRESFYYQLYSVMESEILNIVGASVQRWNEPDIDEPDMPDLLNWMRAFVHAELEGIPLSESVLKVYRIFPDFMKMIEPLAKQEIWNFYQEIIQPTAAASVKFASTENTFWKKYFG